MARRRFTTEFKDGACALVMKDGYGVVEAARKLDIDVSTLRFWLNKRGAYTRPPEPLPPETNDPEVLKVRIKDLEARLRRSEMEKDILKKATAFFASQHP
jgi:transposase